MSNKYHITNEEVRRKLLTMVKKRKLRWFGRVLKDLAKLCDRQDQTGTRRRYSEILQCLRAYMHQLADCLSHSCTQKEITSQTDLYLVILSSRTYVFEDKMTKF